MKASQCIGSLCFLFAVWVQAAEPESLAPLPPQGRIAPVPTEIGAETQRSSKIFDRTAASVDLKNLREDIIGVRRTLERALVTTPARPDADILKEQLTGVKSVTPPANLEYDEVRSGRLDRQMLVLKKPKDPRWAHHILITARIERERAQNAWRELVFLVGKNLDDSRIAGLSQAVSLNCTNLPWEEALERLLAQVGLTHEIIGSETESRVRILELAAAHRGSGTWETSAMAALENASAGALDEVAMESLWLRAKHTAGRGRHWDAIVGYEKIIDLWFQAERPRDETQLWVRKAFMGIGESMAALGQPREALRRFRAFINEAPENDPLLPRAHLMAAKASRELQNQTKDRSFLFQVSDHLETIITRWGSVKPLPIEVPQARLELADLLFEDEAWDRARILYEEHEKNLGVLPHALAFRLAEAQFQTALMKKRGDKATETEALLVKAQEGFSRLRDAALQDQMDPFTDKSLYPLAWLRIGQAEMEKNRPDHVEALFTFLREHQKYPHEPKPARVVIDIARCYAELGAYGRLKEQLWKRLSEDRQTDTREANVQIEDMIGALGGRVDDYPAPVTDKVVFYLSLAAEHEAADAPKNSERRSNLLSEAIRGYQRILNSGNRGALTQSARIGLARASLAHGDEATGYAAVRECLASVDTSARDRVLAAGILGDYYKSKGELRKALIAYEGKVPE